MVVIDLWGAALLRDRERETSRLPLEKILTKVLRRKEALSDLVPKPGHVGGRLCVDCVVWEVGGLAVGGWECVCVCVCECVCVYNTQVEGAKDTLNERV